MIVVHAKEACAKQGLEVELKSIFGADVVPKGRAVFGTVTIPSGARIPVEGTGVHEQDEYSYIVKGSLVVSIDGVEHRVKAGDATLIPAGEAHWAYNDGNEEVLIIWTLVSRK
jgi:quercetin dioxygenase-like cupin family protein